jgi:hypothetical protein
MQQSVCGNEAIQMAVHLNLNPSTFSAAAGGSTGGVNNVVSSTTSQLSSAGISNNACGYGAASVASGITLLAPRNTVPLTQQCSQLVSNSLTPSGSKLQAGSVTCTEAVITSGGAQTIQQVTADGSSSRNPVIGVGIGVGIGGERGPPEAHLRTTAVGVAYSYAVCWLCLSDRHAC